MSVNVRIQRGWQGPRTPLKNHKKIGFLGNTGPDPLKNHKTIKPVFNVGPLLASQRNAISLAGRWWPTFSAISDPIAPHKLKKSWNPLWQNFLDPHMQFSELLFPDCLRMCTRRLVPFGQFISKNSKVKKTSDFLLNGQNRWKSSDSVLA